MAQLKESSGNKGISLTIKSVPFLKTGDLSESYDV